MICRHLVPGRLVSLVPRKKTHTRFYQEPRFCTSSCSCSTVENCICIYTYICMKLIIICLEKLWAPLDIRKRTVDFSSDLEVFPTAAMLHHSEGSKEEMLSTVQKRMRPLWIPMDCWDLAPWAPGRGRGRVRRLFLRWVKELRLGSLDFRHSVWATRQARLAVEAEHTDTCTN